MGMFTFLQHAHMLLHPCLMLRNAAVGSHLAPNQKMHPSNLEKSRSTKLPESERFDAVCALMAMAPIL